MKVLFDTNVIIDAISLRTKESEYCRKLVIMVANEQIEGYLSSKQITDIYYILRKYISNESQRRMIINDYMEIFKILPLLGSDLKYCLNSSISDYEDAVISETAKVNMVNAIVTSNTKDFANAKQNIFSPYELCIMTDPSSII